MENIFAKLIFIIMAELMEVSEDQIVPEANFSKDLGAEHHDMEDIIAAVKEKFKVSISDKIAKEIKTVGDMINAILGAQPENQKA